MRCEDAHVTAEAWSAGRCRYDRAGFDEVHDEAFLQHLHVDVLGARDDDAAYIRCHLATTQDLCRLAHILDAPVRAGADDALVDLDVLEAAELVGVLRKMREGNRRLQGREIDRYLPCVLRICIRLINGVRLRRMRLHILDGLLVNREDTVLSACLDRHVADRETVIHAELSDARAGELDGLVARTIHADLADQVQDDVLTGHPLLLLADEVNPDRGRHLEPELAGRHRRRHIGGTDTSRECPERAIGAGM